MPHLRPRYLEPLLRKSNRFSPITGIFGHRQVGKTTLVSGLSDKYLTLDDPALLESALVDPKTFIESRTNHSLKPLVIDECQFAPSLFPVLKEWVRTHPKPGQFILTGSVRFSSRKLIRESLTGRIIAWELLPMNLSEAHNKPLPDTMMKIAQGNSVEVELNRSAYVNEQTYEKALSQGGLPGIFAVRDVGIRNQRFETQINTLLERDLKLIIETTLGYRALRNLLSVLAFQQNQPLDIAKISRQTRISAPTLRKHLSAFEAMYLVRIIPTEGSEKKPVLFFEDQGEATFLTSNRYDELTQFTRFLFSELRHQWVYRPEAEGSVFQFRNRGGGYIPLCIRIKNKEVGIIPMLEENPSQSALMSAKSFLSVYPQSKVLFVHRGKGDQVLTSRTRCLGVQYLL